MTNKTTVIVGAVVFASTVAVYEYCMRKLDKESEKFWKEETDKLDFQK